MLRGSFKGDFVEDDRGNRLIKSELASFGDDEDSSSSNKGLITIIRKLDPSFQLDSQIFCDARSRKVSLDQEELKKRYLKHLIRGKNDFSKERNSH